MQATVNPVTFRGVYCRHCGRPIRLSASILKRESFMNQSQPNSTEHWRSRVFPHRCRMCGAESIYALNHIVEFEDENPA